MTGVEAWTALLAMMAPAFTQPSFLLFVDLVSGWVLCPGRKTITRMIVVGRAVQRRAHDAYHRFLRTGSWRMADLWSLLATILIETLLPNDSVVQLDLDDTLFHKTGRKVDGAGTYRDPVRSTMAKVVHAWGLNLVVLTLRVRPPWGGEPLGLPINVRLYRKGGPSHIELAKEMIGEVARWFPQRSFRLAVDGAYASLAGEHLPRTHVTSRMRRDAAIYLEAPLRKAGQPGRPRKKGQRLPTPEQIAAQEKQGWVPEIVDARGKPLERLLYCQRVLWYSTCPHQLVLLVICRDPTGKQPDDFFFTTDLNALPSAVVAEYLGRWSIEDTNRNTKQFLGGEDPQSWKGAGPERAAALSFWIYSLVWHWYLQTYGNHPARPVMPWYRSKCTPSFLDALAALRHALWTDRVLSSNGISPLPERTVHQLIEALARAA